ncbi:hypothetical protein AC578_198 [Pseudocercospora eumusae]|uniref:Zn(2)-C6 fungal-type domain-containing protein n=1 Tax=Pseudocercospora eumusae TaxID=321146 RepID=A0A139HIT0_9PEZI|nr:hypothetical protein AC578_198 [Pseudocercospora eumusae]KXT02302.1 hypothetical protein AC578_198 [Pseudocercospora eumusae]
MPISDNWQHSTPDQPRKRRAELVCTTCHSKKIKCDLQSRKNDGLNTCSYCSGSGRDCELRTPKRAKRRDTEGSRDFISQGQAQPRTQPATDADAIAGTGVLRRQQDPLSLQQSPAKTTPQQDRERVVVNENRPGDPDTGR